MLNTDFSRDIENLYEELESILKSNSQLSPADAYEQCHNFLDTWLDSRNDLHEHIISHETGQEGQKILFAQQVCMLYSRLGKIFFDAGAHVSAMAILVQGWNKLAQRQFQTGYRIYRATIALQLAQLAYFQGDIGAATWWALLTQADDHLGADWRGGNGRDMLMTVLGVSQVALDALRAIGNGNRNQAQDQNNWKTPNAFAEDSVIRFALEKRTLSYILGNHSLTPEYPISPAYFTALLDEIRALDRETEDKSTKSRKGKALEKLAAYLLLLIPGWLPLHNVEDKKRTSELDLVVRNIYPSGNLMADIFGRYFIVECKNWKDPIGSRDVGYFLNKIRQSHANFAIIFSKSGITGDDEDETAAKELTRRAFHEDKSVCIVISGSDLERLEKGETTFRSLLLELFEEFRFGRPKSQG